MIILSFLILILTIMVAGGAVDQTNIAKPTTGTIAIQTPLVTATQIAGGGGGGGGGGSIPTSTSASPTSLPPLAEREAAAAIERMALNEGIRATTSPTISASSTTPGIVYASVGEWKAAGSPVNVSIGTPATATEKQTPLGQALQELQPYVRPGGGYDLAKAVAEGKQSAIATAQQYGVFPGEKPSRFAAVAPPLAQVATGKPSTIPSGKFSPSAAEIATINQLRAGFTKIPTLKNTFAPTAAEIATINQIKGSFAQPPSTVTMGPYNPTGLQKLGDMWRTSAIGSLFYPGTIRGSKGEYLGTTGISPIVRENIGAPIGGSLISTEAAFQRATLVGDIQKPSTAQWAIAAGLTGLQLLGLKGFAPSEFQTPTINYAPYTGSIKTGLSTGVPVRGLGQIQTLEGKLYGISIPAMGEGPRPIGMSASPEGIGIGKLISEPLYEASGKAIKVYGESGTSPITIKGFAGKESFGEQLKVQYEPTSGGVLQPKYYIGGKELNIPITPPRNFSPRISDAGFYFPKGSPKGIGGGTTVIPEATRMTSEQAARFQESLPVQQADISRIIIPAFSPLPSPSLSPTKTPVEVPIISTPEVPLITPSIIPTPSIVTPSLPKPTIEPTPVTTSTPVISTPSISTENPTIPDITPKKEEIFTPVEPPISTPTIPVISTITTPPKAPEPPPAKENTGKLLEPVAPVPPSIGEGAPTQEPLPIRKKVRRIIKSTPSLAVFLPKGLKTTGLEKTPAGLREVTIVSKPEQRYLGMTEDDTFGIGFSIGKQVKIGTNNLDSTRKSSQKASSQSSNSRFYRGRELSGTTIGVSGI